MKDIVINTERKYSATVIPNVFIDHFLSSANGAYVKVYLYLLRCLTGTEMQFSVSGAADFFDETESDILRALKYWDKNNVIRLTRNGNDITGITLLDLTTDASAITSSAVKPNANIISINNIRSEVSKPAAEETLPDIKQDSDKGLLSIPTLSRDDVNKALKTDKIHWLVHAVEMYLERPLSSEDQNLVVFLSDHLGFSDELLLHLYELCVEKNKKDIRYIQSVALDWYSHDIKTVDEADSHTLLFSAYFNAVNKAFNLGRLPGDKEQKYINSWEEMGFTPEMVKEACDRALISSGKPSFAYADKVLRSWDRDNIKTLEAAASKDNAFKTAKACSAPKKSRPVSKSAEKYLNRYSQREYSAEDMLEIERQMIEKSMGISIKREG